MTVVPCVKCSVLVVPDAQGKCSTCNSDLSNAAQTKVCPSRQQLGEFLHDKVSSVIAKAIERHVEGCDHCEEVLDALPRAEELHSTQLKTLDGGHDREQTNRAAPCNVEKHGKVRRGDARERVEFLTSEIQFDRYEIQRVLGKGGFGVVYLAFDNQLQRRVAIKMPHPRLAMRPEHAEAYMSEARTVAKLDHPRIVPIYDVGSTAECACYVVTKYIEGVDLSSKIEEHCLNHTEMASLIAKVADALRYTHARGIVHRDIKPGNILIDENGEPFLVDFGLAQYECGGDERPKFAGTPAYMSPEQTHGEGHRVDGQSDIYSLGTVLYELLVGTRPFSGDSQFALIQQIRGCDPTPPRQIDNTIPSELERICLKALAKQTSERYLTARELADELEQFLKNRKTRTHAIIRRTALLVAFVFVAAAIDAWGLLNRRADARRTVAAILLKATDSQLQSLISNDLPPHRRWGADDALRAVVNDEKADPRQRLRASLAMLPVDQSQIRYLKSRLLDCSMEDFPTIRNSLDPYLGEIAEGLWNTLQNHRQPATSRLHAGMTLASFASTSKRWTDADADFLARELTNATSKHQPVLQRSLKPIAVLLAKPLGAVFRDRSSPDEVRDSAASAIARFSLNDEAFLLDLLIDGTSTQFSILRSAILDHEVDHTELRRRLSEIVCRQPHSKMREEDRIELGKHRARAAIALLAFQDYESALEVFRFTTDPESLTQFVHQSKHYGVSPGEIVRCLDQTDFVQARFGLLLALREHGIDEIPTKTVDTLKRKLADWYANDPSSAIHGATGSLLLSWGCHEIVTKVDQTPVAHDRSGVREWFVVTIGVDCFTFVVFRPGRFTMGSPDFERNRGPHERQHEATLTIPFAVADREVTRRQFERFLATQETPWFSMEAWRQMITSYSPSPDHSAVCVSWPLADGYCRWLTMRARQFHAGSNETAVFARNGFRLPMEVEWECACRAGTVTAFGFGSDRELLPRYGWFLRNQDGAAHVSRELLPNLRGVFDMHGNVYELCQDWFSPNVPNEFGSSGGKQSHELFRVRRGGGWGEAASNGRSAARHSIMPTNAAVGPNNGFRIAITLEEAASTESATIDHNVAKKTP